MVRTTRGPPRNMAFGTEHEAIRACSPRPLSKSALVDIVKACNQENIRVVVLNACHTRPQAEALSEVVDCVISMNRAISDIGAITFAASFYGALAFGRSVENAFDQGLARLRAEGISEIETPELMVRAGVDASTLILVGPRDEAVISRMDLRWGTLWDYASDLAVFGNTIDSTVLALIGSSRSLLGQGERIEVKHDSHSIGYYHMRFLNSYIESSPEDERRLRETYGGPLLEMDAAINAIDQLPEFTQPLEFLAKTLYTTKIENRLLIVATPIYVALAE